MKDPSRHRVVLTLADADPKDGLFYVRLRRCLKNMLRSYGLRCERAVELPTPEPTPPTSNTNP